MGGDLQPPGASARRDRRVVRHPARGIAEGSISRPPPGAHLFRAGPGLVGRPAGHPALLHDAGGTGSEDERSRRDVSPAAGGLGSGGRRRLRGPLALPPRGVRAASFGARPCRAGAAAMYYTGPSEDFSRPGRTWYPTLGRTRFPLWGEVSTAYHEGVPGHHLQVGQVRFLAAELSRYQRTMAWCPGYGEGWALYAERLMQELGYLDHPDYELGMLRAHAFRATRVIIDIGMHLELEIPAGEEHAGRRWTPELGLEFSLAHSYNPREFMVSEIDRYLGWPAQAISYKLGEREILALRAELRARQGSAFDLKAFHARMLGL